MTPRDTPRTKALADAMARDARIVGLEIGTDGVLIYTDSAHWCDDSGSGTFRGESESAALAHYRRNVQHASGYRLERMGRGAGVTWFVMAERVAGVVFRGARHECEAFIEAERLAVLAER